MPLLAVTADPSLIAYLKLDEGTGITAADASGNGNTGTLMNGAAWTAGTSLGAVALDGIDDYVRIPHAAALDAFPLTAAVWFKTTTTTGVGGLVNKYFAGSVNGYQLFLNNGSLCAWYFRDSTNNIYDNTGCTLSTPGSNDGQWHQAVFVVDALGGRLYVDGAQKTSRAWTGVAGPTTTAQEIRLGNYPGGGSYLPATADELRIYNRAFSATEITQLYTSTAPPGDTTPPQLSAISAASIGSSAATTVWTTDEPADSQVEYGLTTAYGSSTTLNPAAVTSHSQALSGLASSTLYHYRVKSDDAGSSLASAAVFAPTARDGTSPSVSITAPAGGASVSATVTVTASATDNVGVVGVQLKLDGANLGAEDTTSPYSVSWNTTTAANGSHVLTATARDAAGNATTSAAVSVTVANGVVVTLAPQDTFINLDATNYSTNAQLLTYTWPDNQVANAILMKFDLSAIPPAAVVSDATLQLALVGNDAASETTYTITAHKVVGKSAVIAAATGFTADGVTP